VIAFNADIISGYSIGNVVLGKIYLSIWMNYIRGTELSLKDTPFRMAKQDLHIHWIAL